jgi:uncharacterized SAM-binding protein YcdF (DUF218 family)
MIHPGLSAMSIARSNTDDDGTSPPIAAGRPSRLWRRIAWSSVAAVAAALLLLGLGFVWFVGKVPSGEIKLERGADGIVALTGGASRINDAMELLQQRRGNRLLISGLNRSTTPDEIARLNPEFADKVGCCVDFDWSLNTLGNAREVKRWTERRNFRSLIVVTSNYHMPRALAELAHQMPEVALIAFPVVKAEPWWSNATAARLMVLEYVKLVFAKLRMRLYPGAGEQA